MTDKLSNSLASIETFNKNFISFWNHQVAAQVFNQELGVLAEKIRVSLGEERAELELLRKSIEEKYTEEISHIFPILKKLASQDGELAIECYETLKSSSTSITVNYTRLICANPALRSFFLNCQWDEI